ncbi:MAG: zinc finger-like domain-containing protein [Alphaproteobacteria bacterium]
MTNETQKPLKDSNSIEELDIDQNYKDKAFDIIKKLVKGNNYNHDNITLDAFEGKTLRFSAQNLLILNAKQSSKTLPGRYEKATSVDSEQSAASEMKRAYQSIANNQNLEQNILEHAIKREDKCFGKQADNIIIPLPELTKQFVTFQPCPTCKAKGETICLPCNGNKRVTCNRCHGSTEIQCTQCNGARMIPAPGDASNKIQCPTCNGRGLTECVICNNTGFIQCTACAGRGTVQCTNCKGTAWSSLVFTQEVEIQTSFIYPKNKMPENVASVFEGQGATIIEHIDLNINTDPGSIKQWKEQQTQHHGSTGQEIAHNGNICIPVLFNVTLPYGMLQFTINEKQYQTLLFGKKALPRQVPPFLDDLIKDGIEKLELAANAQGDVNQNLLAASEYRTLKEGITATATLSLQKAQRKLKKANPYGLSNDAIKTIISRSDRALKNTTQKPRAIGLALVSTLYAIIFAIYLLSPLRSAIMSNIPNSAIHILADITILGAAIYIGMLGIQGIAQKTLQKTMDTILSNKLKTAPPKLGKTLYWNILSACTIFLIMLETSRHLGSTAPQWYAGLF